MQDKDNTSLELLGESGSYYDTVFAGSIEGIEIGSSENSFWSQHENGGTADSFKEIASHIPQVKSQLDAGKSLTDIRSDPALEKCVGIYFDPSNIPRVVKGDGYYEFDSNGRHRILAARELGYDIPVKVIAVRTRK